jgi:hypothetical protein
MPILNAYLTKRNYKLLIIVFDGLAFTLIILDGESLVKAYPIDLAIDGDKIILSNLDDKGQSEIPADTDGEAIRIRLDGRNLA